MQVGGLPLHVLRHVHHVGVRLHGDDQPHELPNWKLHVLRGHWKHQRHERERFLRRWDHVHWDIIGQHGYCRREQVRQHVYRHVLTLINHEDDSLFVSV